jgi:hypothetical protein
MPRYGLLLRAFPDRARSASAMGVCSRYAAGDILRLGAAPGRPFPPLDNMLRVTIDTDAGMVKFREVFRKVYQG